jgi:hypothetical protein
MRRSPRALIRRVIAGKTLDAASVETFRRILRLNDETKIVANAMTNYLLRILNMLPFALRGVRRRTTAA